MENNMKILITNEDNNFSCELENTLSTLGFSVIISENNGKSLLDKIFEHHPHLVLAGSFMPEMDLISVISSSKEKLEENIPVFFALLPYESGILEKELLLVNNEIARASGKLANERFLEKAPTNL